MGRRFLFSTAALVFALGCAPMAAQAQTTSPEELDARLRQLEAALKGLQAELAAVKDEKERAEMEAAGVATVAAQPSRVSPAAPAPVPQEGFMIGNTTLRFNGFVKLDTLVTSTSDGVIPSSSVARNFYVPNAIPVAVDQSAQEDPDLDFSVQQTRLIFTTSTPVGKSTIKTLVEGDFQSAPGDGSELFTNAFDFALRRAYIEWAGLTIGQDWTTFMNPALNFGLETADFIGATEGVVFIRQPQIRYRFKNGVSLALENPETTVATFGAAAGVAQDDEFAPDFIARYDGKLGALTYSLSSLFSVLSSDSGSEISKLGFGWGFNGQGKLQLGKDNFNFGVTGGRGVGRYVGLGVAPDAVVTLPGTLTPGGLPPGADLEPIALVAGFVGYRHFWAEKWRSTLAFSAQNVFNDPAQGQLANDFVWSTFLNLFYSPIKNLSFGLEGRFAEREVVSGLEGNLIRGQFVAKYTY